MPDSTAPTVSGTRHRRGTAVRNAVLDVTLDLIADHGYGFTIDDVAAAADVHKTTVYRNWATKPMLVAAAVDRLASRTIDVSRSADPIDDLTSLALAVAATLRTPMGVQAIRSIVAAASDDPDLVDVARRFLTGRYHHATTIIDDAIENGTVRPDTDATLVWESIVNPLHMRAILGNPADDSTAARLVTHALDGARP